MDIISQVMKEVETELRRAKELFPDMQTNHDAYGVIQEELDELWDEMKQLKPSQFNDRMRTEAIQLAAMVVRCITDRCAPCNERVD